MICQGQGLFRAEISRLKMLTKLRLFILPSSFGGSVLVTATISKKTTGSSLVGFDDAFYEFQLFDI